MRLVVSKMVLENFKSYAGVQTIGPFHKCFSAIVGPNGSGKSNVIDALLFVFGYRATKLRLSNLKQLIHKSAKVSNATYAKVSVFFEEIIDTEDGSFSPVPNSEIEIARVVNEKGTSTYYLNNSACQYANIRQLLLSKGLDLEHNRFLILQGEVESISQMKPKSTASHDGLLEYLEDIIGTSDLLPEIEEKSKQLVEFEEDLENFTKRHKEAQLRVSNLEQKKTAAEKFLTHRMELAVNQHKKLQIEELKLSRQAKLIDEDVVIAKENLVKAKEEAQVSDEIRNQLRTIENEVDDIRCNLNTYRKDVTKWEDKKKEIELEGTILTEKKTLLEKKKGSINQKKIAAETELRSLQEQLERKQRKYDKTVEKLEENERALVFLKEEEDKILSGVREKAGHVIDELAVKKQSISPKLEEILLLQSEIRNFNAEITVNEAKISVLNSELSKLKQNGQETVTNIERVKQTITENTKFLRKSEKERDTITSSIKSLEKSISSLSSSLSRNQAERNRLKEAEVTQRSQSKVMNTLKDAQQHGLLKGVHGRLGDLGTIESQYLIACSLASGAFDHIVVDSVNDAEQCVEYLRQTNSGRATFIVLEQISNLKNKYESGRGDAEPDAPRLVDLVQCSSVYIPAFYYALRNSLVCKDIDRARQISFARKPYRRVVTLKGEIIEPSGAMCGGGSSKVRIKIGSSTDATFSPEEISKLDQIIQQLSAQHKDESNQLGSLVQQLEQMDRKCVAAQREVEELTTELSNLETFLSHIKKTGSNQQQSNSELKVLHTENENLTKQCVIREKQISKIESTMGTIKSEITTLEQRIEQLAGNQLSEVEEAYKLLNSEMSSLQDTKTMLTVTIDELASNVSKKTDEIMECSSKIASFSNEIAELNIVIVNLKTKFEDVCRHFESAQAQFDLHNAKLVQLSEEHDKLNTEFDEKTRLVKNFEKELAQLNKSRESFTAKISKVRSSLITYLAEYRDARDSLYDSERFPPDIELIDQNLEGKPLKKFEDVVLTAIQKLTGLLDESSTDIRIINEYRQVAQEFKSIDDQFNQMCQEKERISTDLDELKSVRLSRFLDGFNQICQSLKEIYQMITFGGDAELELVDSLDPFSEGIMFSVRPARKSWKNISNLSGGEKTLSSLALIFALHSFKRNPIYVLDEIDAALDFRNVAIIAAYLSQKTKDAQFIVISLRNDMFEMANRLIGIYKIEDKTQSAVLDPCLLINNVPSN
ncbi:hypothetical protein RCL1_004548 [Eukaryota sp. TZLM3-RCL]